jgi:hypothetical protein
MWKLLFFMNQRIKWSVIAELSTFKTKYTQNKQLLRFRTKTTGDNDECKNYFISWTNTLNEFK